MNATGYGGGMERSVPDIAFGALLVLGVFPVFLLVQLSTSQSIAAVLPFALGAVAFGTVAVVAAAGGRKWAISLLFIFAFFGLSFGMRMDGYARTGGMDWQNMTKLVAWLLIFLIFPFHVRRLVPFLRERTILLALIYGGVAFASSAWSLIPAYTAANSLGLISYLILACIVVSVLGAEATIRLLTLTLLVFLTIGLISGIALPDIAWLPPSAEENVYRLRGFSGHPNVLGAQAALLVTFAVVLRRRRRLPAMLFLPALLVGFAAIIAADSRTMLAATIVVWFVISLRERKLLGPMAALGGAGLIFAVALIAVGEFPDLTFLLGPLARTGSISEVVTLTGRTELWIVSGELIAQKPVLGWGFGGTEALLIESVGRAFQGAPVNAHNMYIQAIFNLGFLGALPIFALLGILVTRMWTRPDSIRDQPVLLMMVMGVTEVSILALPVLLTFTFFLVLAREAQPDVAGGAPAPSRLKTMRTA